MTAPFSRAHILSSINPEPARSGATGSVEGPSTGGNDGVAATRRSLDRDAVSAMDANRENERPSADDGERHGRTADGPAPSPQARPRSTRFRFKGSSSSSSHHHRPRRKRGRSSSPAARESEGVRRRRRSSRDREDERERDDDDDDDDDGSNPSRRSRQRRRRRTEDDDGDSHRHRSSRRSTRKTRPTTTTTARETTPPNPYDPPPLSPATAFREALFDALADDEGAAYWEGVYGQPLHVYADERTQGGGHDEEQVMDDEQFAAHVRRRMWERTREGAREAERERLARLEEERRKVREREEERERARGKKQGGSAGAQDEDDDERRERERVARRVEAALDRGADRRRDRQRRAAWDAYKAAWAAWDLRVKDGGEASTATRRDAELIGPEDPASLVPWPVESGRAQDVADEAAVRLFLSHGLGLAGSAAAGSADARAALERLKDERVRWHPDKVQQRLGGSKVVGADVMRKVTAVFQIVDGLYGEVKARAKVE